MWEITVSADGSSVSARPWPGAMGRLRSLGSRWHAQLADKDKVFHIVGKADPVSVPPAEYAVTEFAEWLGDGKGAPVEINTTLPPARRIKVAEGQTVEVDVGAPYAAILDSYQDGSSRQVRFFVRCRSKYGEEAQVLDPGSRYSPVLEITDADGRLLDRIRMNGDTNRARGQYDATWRPPADVKNPVKVTAKAGAPFISEIAPITLTVRP